MKTLSSICFIFFLVACQTMQTDTPIIEQHAWAFYSSGYKLLSLHDASRNKDLDASLWYPAEENASYKVLKTPYPWGRIAEDAQIKDKGKRKPLVVLSHGFSGNPFEFYWIVEPLVSAGYVVLATKHSDLPGPQLNHWNRALDVSFILNEVLKSPFGPMLDEHRIGFIGFSLGGMTGMLLAGARASNTDAIVPNETHVKEPRITEEARLALPSLDKERMRASYLDHRIKAAFLMAPAWSWIFDAKDIQGVTIPISIVSGDQDEVVVPQTNGMWFAKHAPQSQFRWLHGAGHFIFLGAPSCEGRMTIDPEGIRIFLYRDNAGVNREYVHEQVTKLAIEFFARL